MASANKRKKQPTPSPRVYCGELYYADVGDQIEVSRFIVRKDTIAFDLLTEWNLGGHWRFCGVAKLLSNGAFLSDHVVGTEMVGKTGGNESVPVRLRFEIEKQSDLRIQISGILFLRGDANKFAGKLKKFIPRNHS